MRCAHDLVPKFSPPLCAELWSRCSLHVCARGWTGGSMISSDRRTRAAGQERLSVQKQLFGQSQLFGQVRPCQQLLKGAGLLAVPSQHAVGCIRRWRLAGAYRPMGVGTPAQRCLLTTHPPTRSRRAGVPLVSVEIRWKNLSVSAHAWSVTCRRAPSAGRCIMGGFDWWAPWLQEGLCTAEQGQMTWCATSRLWLA